MSLSVSDQKTVKRSVNLYRTKTLLTHNFTISDREGISHLANPFFLASCRWRGLIGQQKQTAVILKETG